MTAFFASGRAVDLVIAVMIVEAVILRIRHRGKARTIVLTLAPGLLILLGLRAALVGADWTSVALPLALSYPAHLADLWSRGLLRR